MVKTILVIDDEEGVQNLFFRFFTMKGLRVITAGSVAAARELIDESDLVVSDVRIGAENGLEFLEEIRCRGDGKPFIFMSGMQIDSEHKKAIVLNGHPVLYKPDITRVFLEIDKEIHAG